MSLNTPPRAFLTLTFTLSLLATTTSCTKDDVSVEPWKIDETPEMSAPDLLEMGPAPIQPLSMAKNRACTSPDPAPQCSIQRADTFGDCGLELGAVFDGTQCVPVTGCACTGEDCPLFESVSQCATACSIQGWCQVDKLHYFFYPVTDRREPPCDGYFCGTEFSVCIKSEVDPSNELNKTAPDLPPMRCRPGGDGSYCPYRETRCSREDWCCFNGNGWADFDATQTTQMCAISLLATSTHMNCIRLE